MPAVAIARAIETARPGARILVIGTGRPAEAEILGPYGWERRELEVRGLKGGALAKAPGALWLAAKALKKAADIVRAFKPQLGVCTGGYVAGPAGLAIKLSGTPLVIHEQNSLPGLTNRALGLFADMILLAFPEAKKRFPEKRTFVVGNPVRSEIAALGSHKRDFSAAPKTVVVLGGSQGSKKINQAAVQMVEGLARKGIAAKVIHQTGAAMEDEVRESYKGLGIEAEVKSFFSDMAAVYKAGHLAVCRAGALTVFELAAARLPAILVPLPTAADDHQSLNAKALADLGLAKVVRESDLESGALLKEAAALLESSERLNEMSDSDLSPLQGLEDQGSLALAEKMLKLAERRQP